MAALEAAAFQVFEVVAAMRRDSGRNLQDCSPSALDPDRDGDLHLHLRVDGGMSANSLFMQFQSDLLGLTLLRPSLTETTALGAGEGRWTKMD